MASPTKVTWTKRDNRDARKLKVRQRDVRRTLKREVQTDVLRKLLSADIAAKQQ